MGKVEEPTMLKTKEAADRIGNITPNRLRAIVRAGEGPAHYVFGGQYRFRPQDVDEWVESHRVDPWAEAEAS